MWCTELRQKSHHEDAEVCQVVTQADRSVAAGVFRRPAALSVPASGSIWWRHRGITAHDNRERSEKSCSQVRVKHGDMSDLVSTSIILHHHTDKTLFQSLITTTSSLKIKPGPVQDPSRTGPGSSNFYVSGLTYSPYFQLLRATLETILILYEQIRTDLDQDLKGTWTEPSWTSDDSCRTLNTVWNTRCLFSSLMWRLVWMYVCDK